MQFCGTENEGTTWHITWHITDIGYSNTIWEITLMHVNPYTVYIKYGKESF